MSEEITNTENSTNSNEKAKENVSGCLKALGMVITVAVFVVLPIFIGIFLIFSPVNGITDIITTIIKPEMFNYNAEYYTYHEAIHNHIAQIASELSIVYVFGLGAIGILILILNAFTNLLVIIMSDGIGNKLESILKDKENKN